jgi:hypothetical protein
MQLRPWAVMTTAIGAKNKENKIGPKTDPWGMPNNNFLSFGKASLTFTD